MKFKVGDRVEVIGRGVSYRGKVGIVKDDEYELTHPYDVHFDNGTSEMYKERDIKLATPTLEDMPKTTELVDDEGNEMMVLHVYEPGLYLMSNYSGSFDKAGVAWTAKELKSNEWKIKIEDDMVTITVEGETKRISRQSAKELNLIN